MFGLTARPSFVRATWSFFCVGGFFASFSFELKILTGSSKDWRNTFQRPKNQVFPIGHLEPQGWFSPVE